MVRCLVGSTDDLSREEVCFSTDFDSPASYFFCMSKGDGFTVRIDEIINELPSRFPLDEVLIKV